MRKLRFNPSIAPTIAEIDPEKRFEYVKKKFGMYSGKEIQQLAHNKPNGNQLVEGLLAPASVNILVGDSGIGKSPLAYQLGLAVSTGVPFLGMKVTQGKVVYMDYENHDDDIAWMTAQQTKHLQVTVAPFVFMVWNLAKRPEERHVNELVRMLSPELVIIDSLRVYCPEMETDSVRAVEAIRKLRDIANHNNTCFLLVHHLRKHQLHGAAASLEEGHALDWLRRAAGVRALVNQTDVRLGLARRANSKPREEGSDEMVLSGHYRTRGEVGPLLIRRVFDDDGEPCGYERFVSCPEMLENAEQEAVFKQLPATFSFKQIRLAFGRAASTTNFFIQKLIRLGLVRKTGRGTYQRGVFSGRERTVAS